MQWGIVDFQWPETRTFTCDRQGMVEAVAWMQERLGLLACGEKQARRALLVVDELYANTLLHGGATARSGFVELAIERVAGGVQIFYADSGPTFDTAGAAASGSAPVDGHVGGAGLLLLRHLCRSIGYERHGTRNRIVVELLLAATPGD